MPAPTFICIGVQKGGTTSFINYMNRHPEIYVANNELHFFDSVEPVKERILSYESAFTPGNKKIIGEKTPSYCYLRPAIDRIYRYNPRMKLVMILREPVSRAYSHYNMDFPTGNNFLEVVLKEKDVPSAAIKKNGLHHVVRGFYDQQINYILSKFPREQLHIAISEEIKTNKQEEYNSVFRFLGTTKEIEIDTVRDMHIRKYQKPIKRSDALVLYNIYKPHIEKLYRILGRRIIPWENYYNQLLSDS